MSTKNLFKKSISYSGDDHVQKLMAGVADTLASTQDAATRSSIAQYVYASESFDENKYQLVEQTMNNLEQSLKEMTTNIGIEHYQSSQASAAIATAIGVSDIGSFAKTKVGQVHVKTGFSSDGREYNTVVGTQGLADAFEQRVAVENFDERDNRNAEVMSVAYNLEAGRQNEFGETFFPTVTVSNDNVGVAVSIRLTTVFDDFKRSTEGALAAFNRRNIVRAMLDSSILKNEGTRVVPVFEPGNAPNNANFDTSEVADYDYNLEGEVIRTAPLKFGTEIGDLIGLSSTQALIDNGLMNNGDTLDPAIYLDAIYLKLGADVFKFRLSGLARTAFIAAPEGDSRDQILNFETESLKISRITKLYDGSALGDFVEVVNQDLTVLLTASINGKVSVSTGRLKVHALDLGVKAVLDQDGNELPLGSGIGQTLAALVDPATAFVGYDIKAYRSNLNRRQRGQLLDTTVYNQIWAVPLRSPITVPRPVNSTSQTDASDLASLISATFVRTSNEAVTTLIDTAQQLGEFTVGRGNIEGGIAPDLFGVARFLVKPTYIAQSVDVNAIINSVSSHEKNADISAVLLNAIRDVAYRAYRDSGFQAMVETGAAGISGNPTVLIGTDPMTARYLMVDGDARTLGPDFEFKVTTTPDERMQGQIAIAFGYPGLTDNALNPAHFGNMLWSPEMTLVLPMQRSGGVQKELVVSPRFRHIVNVPVMGWIQASGIPEVVTSRVPLHFVDKT
jgi:hypothetical protein